MEVQAVTAQEREPHELVARIERLLEEIELLRDPAGREKATEVVQALLSPFVPRLPEAADSNNQLGVRTGTYLRPYEETAYPPLTG